MNSGTLDKSPQSYSSFVFIRIFAFTFCLYLSPSLFRHLSLFSSLHFLHSLAEGGLYKPQGTEADYSFNVHSLIQLAALEIQIPIQP